MVTSNIKTYPNIFHGDVKKRPQKWLRQNFFMVASTNWAFCSALCLHICKKS